MATKAAVILQAGCETHEGLARALHAFLYARELREKNHEVRLIFDGAGTTWLDELQKPDHKLRGLYEETRKAGLLYAVCDFCSAAFNVKNSAKNSGIPLRGEVDGHPSFAALIEEGAGSSFFSFGSGIEKPGERSGALRVVQRNEKNKAIGVGNESLRPSIIEAGFLHDAESRFFAFSTHFGTSSTSKRG